jgi:hypothetical protein
MRFLRQHSSSRNGETRTGAWARRSELVGASRQGSGEIGGVIVSAGRQDSRKKSHPIDPDGTYKKQCGEREQRWEETISIDQVKTRWKGGQHDGAHVHVQQIRHTNTFNSHNKGESETVDDWRNKTTWKHVRNNENEDESWMSWKITIKKEGKFTRMQHKSMSAY